MFERKILLENKMTSNWMQNEKNHAMLWFLVERRKHKTNYYEVCWVRDRSVPNCQPWIDIIIIFTPIKTFLRSIFSSNDIFLQDRRQNKCNESKVGNLFQILEAITQNQQKNSILVLFQRLQFLQILKIQTITFLSENGLGTQNVDTYHLMRKFMTAIVNNKEEKNNYGSGLG